jgi:hypothetical protein
MIASGKAMSHVFYLIVVAGMTLSDTLASCFEALGPRQFS